METCTWIITGIAILGTFLNARQNINGFVCWIISDTYLMLLNIDIGQYAQAALFFIFLLLAIYGVFQWGKKEKVL